jgi:hypothetical protein
MAARFLDQEQLNRPEDAVDHSGEVASMNIAGSPGHTG